MSDTCINTTTCFPCNQGNSCEEGCIIENFDACCVQYKGEPLENLNIDTNDTLCEALVKLNELSFSETLFSANSTNSIIGAPNGLFGHSPFYHVRLNPNINQAITVSSQGLFVDKSQFLEGKVKVNASDTLDYLQNQLFPGSDGNNIITITPTVIGGGIYLVPSLNKANLLNWIKDDLCNLVSDCIPAAGTTTTSTSTTSTSTSSTSSTTSTSTTTVASNNFIVNNNATKGTIYAALSDQVANLTYIGANVFQGQSINQTYNGSNNVSEVSIVHGSNVPLTISLTVDNVLINTQNVYIGATSFSGIPAKSNVVITITDWVGTTTSSTSSTSSTSTSSTSSPQCVTVTITNTTGAFRSANYISCQGYPQTLSLNPSQSVQVCLINGTLSVGTGVTSVVDAIGCNQTTTSTSSTSTSTTTAGPCNFVRFENNTGSNTEIMWVPCGETEYIGATILAGQQLSYCINPSFPPTLNDAEIFIETTCDTTTTTSSTSTSSTSTSTSSTSSTSTSSSSSTSTSTTTLPPCTSYTISEDGEEGSSFTYDYTNCEGEYITYSGVVGDAHLPITDCIQTGTVIGSGSCIISPPIEACTV
jgi:hypothetical protein